MAINKPKGMSREEVLQAHSLLDNEKINVMKKTALEGLESLYNGDLAASHETMENTRQFLNRERRYRDSIKGTGPEFDKYNARVKVIQKKYKMLQAYDQVLNAETETDFYKLLNSDNPLLQQVMPTAEYVASEFGERRSRFWTSDDA